MSKYKDLTKEKLLEIVEQQDKELQDPKKYGLFWDKEKVVENVVADCENNLPVLKRIGSKEIKTDDSEDNILIEGDNYHALNVLNYTHRNKIDVIYIDPPYNTGNGDFKYNDKFIDKENGYRHSMWLNFMEKRLKLAKNLLSKTGVIFVSIDDNEQAQLRMLCAQIFGDDNFVGEFIWQKQGNDNKSIFSGTNTFRNDHEFVIVYAKNAQNIKFDRPEEEATFQNDYGNVDNDPRGNWMSAELGKSDKRSLPHGKNYFTLKSPTGVERTRQWHYSENEIQELIKDNRIYFGKNGDSVPRLKKFLSDKVQKVPSSLLLKQGSTKVGIEEIANIFGGQRPFDYPKPVELIKYILQLHLNKSATILDFFAGSGTTGQAVLELNKDDKGNRKFILCTNDENNICTDVCYPRVEKIINGYKNLKNEKVSGLGGNLKYFKTDFVKNTNNRDQLKINLTKKCTEILCVKENIFNLKKDQENYKIFTSNDGNRHLCIYYNFIDKDFDDFVKDVSKLDGEKAVYIFALNNKIDKKRFKGIPDVSFEAIPYKILEVYEQLVKISKK